MDAETLNIFHSEFKKRAHDLNIPYVESEIRQIAESKLESLFNIEPLYFNRDTEDFIAAAAAKNLAKTLSTQSDIDAAWASMAENFRDNAYWGFPTQVEKPQAPRTNTVKELAVYVWTMIQAFLIMKTVIFYYGLKSSSEDETKTGTNSLLFMLAVSFSFSSLLYFAWRKNRNK
jgi:hypothetical protein